MMEEALTYFALSMGVLGLALNAWAFLRARRARLTLEKAERKDRAKRGALVMPMLSMGGELYQTAEHQTKGRTR